MESTTSIATVEMYTMFPLPPSGIPVPRGPLTSKTNAPYPSKIPVRHVRRKTSYLRLQDSSEENPSSHESIYEAQITHTNSDASQRSNIKDAYPMLNMREHIHQPPLDALTKENTRNNTRLHKNKYAVDDIKFLYGQGTVLNTITEKNSNGTMHTLARTQSMGDLDKINQLGHRDSLIIAKVPRHKNSFSTGDLDFIRNSYHNALSAIENTVQIPPPMYKLIYAEPKAPVVEPPNRPGTPPGMPSWTEHQRAPRSPPRRQSASPTRFKRYFSLSPSKNDSDNIARLIAEQEERARLAIPRFRPPRSVYGPISQHPYSRATVAKSSQANVETQPPRLIKTRASSNKLRSQVPKFLSKYKRENTPDATSRRLPIPEIRIQSATTITTSFEPCTPEGSIRLNPAPNNSPAESPLTPQSADALRVQRNLIYNPATRSPPTPSSQCSHNRHAGYELRSPDYFSPLTLSDYRLPPVLTQWRSRSPSRQPTVGGFPDFSTLVMDSPGAESVNSRTHLMAGGLGEDGSSSPQISSHAYPHTRLRTRDRQEQRMVPGMVHIQSGDGPPGDGCWKCRISDKVNRVEEWIGKCFCFFCCGFMHEEEEDAAEHEEVRYGTAEVVRSQRGSVVWAGPGTSAGSSSSMRTPRDRVGEHRNVRSGQLVLHDHEHDARDRSDTVNEYRAGIWN